ncbi:SSS family solute:Na+ symporter [Tamaricihabitans halophyticus]|uniref:SSS family solute:Na+ symporter n=1 Tax=Tamaricihabitans halophyticus TaxID=1262583 RepID=A0A4R2QXU8_9PSEU|nr:sodium:solute symporter [Tamaricihabitans halophyticus]TCP53989.1 SSS family solute:Na+ symporter [Tamaricihabitans halophyticus]
MTLDYLVIGLYLVGVLGIGWRGMRLAKTRSDFLVAGRRLGTFLYAGTMSAVVLGGASTIGGVGLGYTHGISGAWLVITIGLGILVLHALFVRRIVRLKVFTVAEMLKLRYGSTVELLSGVVMWGYTLMLSVTSILSFATIFTVLFDLPAFGGIALGGGIVVCYSVLGGMWSITLTDIVQFLVTTVGMFFLLLPISLATAGGFSGIADRVGPDFFDFTSIGGATILAYVLTYGFGLLIGQDIWQRVFTARSPKVATTGGLAAGVYCVLYAFAGALIGTAARAEYPNLANADDAFATIVDGILPAGIRGLVLVAALAALMSTASGALIACSAVSTNDIWARLRGRQRPSGEGEVGGNRVATLLLGALAIGIAGVVNDVVAALTVAYNILVGGLLVAILGGLFWRRATRIGAAASMIIGSAVVLLTMFTNGLLAEEAIYYGLGASLLSYVLVSLVTARTEAEVLDNWERRLAGEPATEREFQ